VQPGAWLSLILPSSGHTESKGVVEKTRLFKLFFLLYFPAGLMGKLRVKKMPLAKRGFLGDIRPSHKVAFNLFCC